MKKLNVKIRDQHDNISNQTAEGDDLRVEDGNLIIFDDQGKGVASYAAGYWISVTPLVL